MKTYYDVMATKQLKHGEPNVCTYSPYRSALVLVVENKVRPNKREGIFK